MRKDVNALLKHWKSLPDDKKWFQNCHFVASQAILRGLKAYGWTYPELARCGCTLMKRLENYVDFDQLALGEVQPLDGRAYNLSEPQHKRLCSSQVKSNKRARLGAPNLASRNPGSTLRRNCRPPKNTTNDSTGHQRSQASVDDGLGFNQSTASRYESHSAPSLPHGSDGTELGALVETEPGHQVNETAIHDSHPGVDLVGRGLGLQSAWVASSTGPHFYSNTAIPTIGSMNDVVPQGPESLE